MRARQSPSFGLFTPHFECGRFFSPDSLEALCCCPQFCPDNRRSLPNNICSISAENRTTTSTATSQQKVKSNRFLQLKTTTTTTKTTSFTREDLKASASPAAQNGLVPVTKTSKTQKVKKQIRDVFRGAGLGTIEPRGWILSIIIMSVAVLLSITSVTKEWFTFDPLLKPKWARVV